MNQESVYPQALRESIRNVERTRKERIDQELSTLSLAERESLLRKHHPDYRGEMFRELLVGADKGSRTPHELADLFEAYGVVGEGIDLSTPDYDTDVLVIGGGGAGVSAALIAQECGARVLLTTKLRVGDANTMMAQGGIQAADKEGDSPAIHYLDVVGGGGFHNVPALVRALVRDAPSAIGWLEKLGVMFDKEADGTMSTIHGGGTSRKRMHSARDYSGGDIMKTLRDELQNREVQLVEFAPACELLTDGARCTGAVLYNMETQEFSVVRAKATILATGGSGRLHVQKFPTTNHYGATADGLVLGYRAGGRLLFVDTIQYHPTGAAFPEQIVGLLVTEKLRGLGAQLVNAEGNRFVYELETRDVEAAAIIRECHERGKGVRLATGMQGVWLDSPLIEHKNGSGTIQKRLPAMYRQYQRFGIDMRTEPILVYPTQHYQNGGLKIDAHCRTDVENLYAAGEVSGGVHGRNRLMGNSLLDIVVFGRRAGRCAAEAAKQMDGKGLHLTLAHLHRYQQELEEQGIPCTRRSPVLLPDYRRRAATSANLLDSM